MKALKTLLSLLTVCALLFAAVPGNAKTAAESGRGLHSAVAIDDDPEGGYTGDYVVICNPSENVYDGLSTGSLAGRINTQVEGSSSVIPVLDETRKVLIDVDGELMEETRRIYGKKELVHNPVKADYPVGSTKDFYIGYRNPDGSAGDITFKVLYVGANCRIWTPVGTGSNGNYYPLDGIDESYAKSAADAFDSKFDLMIESYGGFFDMNDDGKINLMFYNVEDGWSPSTGGGYVGGYFSANDFYNANKLPMIHIDTYPGVFNGETSSITDCYSTTVHEFQHLINFSNTYGWMATWLNESLSGSAEELCFPGDALVLRIVSWHNYYYISRSRTEYEYSPSVDLHTGASLTDWSGSLAQYGEVLLFSQYLYTRFGSTEIFKKIIQNGYNTSDQYSFEALKAATGLSMDTLWRDFFTSMIANCREYNLGFNLNEGYTPEGHYDLEDPYSLLCPVVYTGSGPVIIYGGGFITVKTLDGVFVPPENADPNLKYIGVDLDPENPPPPPPAGLLGDADGNGAVEAADALLILRYSMGIIGDEGIHLENCDYDGSGRIDATDALLVLRKSMGII
ncbi:MAG: dockerin type I repeat-containing protein [Clostridiales bacterium]|nr:dockerin type I repeat-containing protein [Clostridiales bacterium]